MAKKDMISQSLGIEPMIDPSSRIMDAIPLIKADKNDDYEYARTNLYSIIEKGQNALEDIIDIAKQSESARAYEVATNLIKTMTEANKDLLNLAKAKKELEKVENPETKNITNNNLVLTSADLLKIIKGNNE